jgi:hypothetical protein
MCSGFLCYVCGLISLNYVCGLISLNYVCGLISLYYVCGLISLNYVCGLISLNSWLLLRLVICGVIQVSFSSLAVNF